MTARRAARGVLVAGMIAATAAVPILPAGADHFSISDLCLGVDHPPFEIDPPGGGNSYLVGSAVTDPATPGVTIEVRVDGPSAPAPFDVTSSDDATIAFAAAIQTYGEYGISLWNEAHEIASGTVSVGPDDQPCPDPVPPAPPSDDTAGHGLQLGLAQLAFMLAGRDVPSPVELFLGLVSYVDPVGDHIYSDPAFTAGAPLPTTDIVQAGGALITIPPELAEPGGPLDCDLPPEFWIVACPEDSSDVWADGFVMSSVRLNESPLVLTNDSDPHEFAAVFESNGDPSDDWQPQGSFTWDGFQGTDRWYVVHGGPTVGEWDLEVSTGPGEPVESGARAILVEDVVVFLVPIEELPAATGWRGYAFNHDGTYQPERSAMDVTGADPTGPLLAIPTATFGAAIEEPSPSPDASPDASSVASPVESPAAEILEPDAVAIGTSDDGGPMWPLVGLGLVTVAGGATLLRRREGIAAVVDPCTEELALLDAARDRCAEARAAEAAARERLAGAESALASARAGLSAARADLPGAGTRDRSSWVESEGRRIDSGDIAAGREADAATWEAYRAGEITAEEAMERWEKRGTPEEITRLREADAAARAAEQAVAAAEAEVHAASAAVAAAESAASAACSEVDAAAAQLERCRDRVRAEAATAPAGGASTTTAGGTGTVTAPRPTLPVVSAGGDDPRDEDDTEDGCCGSGIWILYGRSTASMGVVWGRELINITAVCVSDTNRWIEFEVLVERWGLGADIGGGGLVGIAYGAPHPADVYDAWLRNAGGFGVDIDVGLPWLKLAKSGYQLRKTGKLLDALKKLPRTSVPPPKLPAAELKAVKDAAQTAVTELTGGAGPSLAGQAAKGSLGDVIVVPVGLAAGIGAHWGTVERSQIVARSGCRHCQGRGQGRR